MAQGEIRPFEKQAIERGVVGAVPTVASQWGFVAILFAAALVGYSSHVGTAPLQGEESRWAQGARWMLWTGDWIVPRQQGMVFPERPPMNSWLIAVASRLTGRVDSTAIRLPSVLATMSTMALLYVYGSWLRSRATGILAAAAYGSFGQVLQLGRRGESEAVFTCFVAASLLLWHMGWESGKSRWKCWLIGFSLAGLGALTKGLQAPVYFVAASAVYLLSRRQWREFIRVEYWAGVAAFLLVVGLWFAPFWLVTDRQAAIDIWTGLARDRVQLAGLLAHIAMYPWETLACLLPWSVLLLQFGYREVRKQCRHNQGRSGMGFLVLCVLTTYPSLWFVAGARGRYFMPLYPVVAVIVAIAIALTIDTQRGWSRRGLRLWQWVMATISIVTPLGFLIATRWLGVMAALPDRLAISAICVMVMGVGVALAVWKSPLTGQRWEGGFTAIAAWLMIAVGWLYVPTESAHLHALDRDIGHIQEEYRIDKLRSIGPVYHRFAYYYGRPIEELPFPESRQDVPADLDYFCFDVLRNDTNERHACGRGRSWRPVPGRVPFRWEEVGRIRCDPKRRDQANRVVVIGRVVRDEDGEIAWQPNYPLIDPSAAVERLVSEPAASETRRR